MLWLKLLLTPLIVGAVTLIGRRWGPRAAGLIVGLPLTTGPISVFLATEQGPRFAARAAGGAVNGLVATGCFCAVFAVNARTRTWATALTTATAALLAATLALRGLALPWLSSSVVALMILAALWLGVTRATRAAELPVERRGIAGARPSWDLPVRTLLSTAMVASITALAGTLGSEWSGLLSALPVFATILGVFTFQQDGRKPAIALMRASIVGCVSGVLFFVTVQALLMSSPPTVVYSAATVVAVGSGAALAWVTRLSRPG